MAKEWFRRSLGSAREEFARSAAPRPPRPGKLRSPQAATEGRLVSHAKSSARLVRIRSAPMPRSLACLLTPHGALRLEAAEDDTALDASVAERLEAAFRKGDGHGLLQLGLAEAGSRLPPDLAFWRAFAMRFVAAVCTAGENAVEAVYPPAPGEEGLKTVVEQAPPMRGGEYLDAGRLAALWEALAQAFEAERSESGLSVGEFLASRDSRWRQVGRVHLNLAENRKDAERPFAFLATYASSLAAHGALRHAPLGAALREYAGAGANSELLKLLEPVSRAGESCAWLKAIVNSGEIFHPLRWTPSEAMRLLSDIEPLEQAGVVVRMPAAWRAGGRAGRRSTRRSARIALAGRRGATARFPCRRESRRRPADTRGDREPARRDRRPGAAARPMGRGRCCRLALNCKNAPVLIELGT